MLMLRYLWCNPLGEARRGTMRHQASGSGQRARGVCHPFYARYLRMSFERNLNNPVSTRDSLAHTHTHTPIHIQGTARCPPSTRLAATTLATKATFQFLSNSCAGRRVVKSKTYVAAGLKLYMSLAADRGGGGWGGWGCRDRWRGSNSGSATKSVNNTGSCGSTLNFCRMYLFSSMAGNMYFRCIYWYDTVVGFALNFADIYIYIFLIRSKKKVCKTNPCILEIYKKPSNENIYFLGTI